MEIMIFILLYYLLQNSDFAKRIKPLLENLKNSQEMLSILKELSSFMQSFKGFQENTTNSTPNETASATEEKKTSESPTSGIADEFIQNILDSYLKNK